MSLFLKKFLSGFNLLEEETKMKKNSLQELGWALGLMLLPVLYAIWVYQTLPENLAIHFDLSGKGNAFYLSFSSFGFSNCHDATRSYDLLDNHCQRYLK